MKLEITIDLQGGDAEAIRDVLRPLIPELARQLRDSGISAQLTAATPTPLPTRTPKAKQWMSTSEVAEYMGCSVLTVLRLLRTKQMIGYQSGPKASWRINRDDVELYIRGEKPNKRRRR
ncbi:helix-turn-helix domain-containing protein [Rhodococcus sp. KBS0724]|uniref:excisionase family DNA-binding protein n=1 Tax=Rhodococcus sp. KBS0724 TaxID=1179674 RepID=UPI00110D62DF|nr:excisionase family DNA-binding protein [Rhodococcus sp. KBS0724]TSD47998.1 helix-turn-helix domain-containing protein [Rhodococcus sp. KBS0724]